MGILLEQTVHILNANKQVVESLTGEVQPYLRSFTFEDGYTIDMTKRLFCDLVSTIKMDSYIEIENELHKVIHMKKWSDYLEVWLYESQQQIGDET